MIRRVIQDEIGQCVRLIRESFRTVADEFGFTEENAGRFTAFATTEERLRWHLEQEKRAMFVFCENGKIVGYYSLTQPADGECELNNLCVSPEYRHRGIGMALLEHAERQAEEMGASAIVIGIVEENVRLRRWYEAAGFVHTGVRKFDFFPFTCGYMRKEILPVRIAQEKCNNEG